MKVNLGCPKYCEGWTCVDLNPRDTLYVIRANVFDWLSEQNKTVDEIYTKNLLEHLTDPGAFLVLCKEALIDGGILRVVTDNAEFFPFYLPLVFFVINSFINGGYLMQICHDPSQSAQCLPGVKLPWGHA